MSRYRRMYVPGGRYFVTVNIAHRGQDVLVRHIEVLRHAVRVTRAERPFEIVAMVVMPDHLHCVWSLPDGDADFSTRWGAIKARFSIGVRRAGFTPPPHFPCVTTGQYAGVNPGLPVHLERRDKRLLRDIHLTELAHFLLTRFLLFQQLFLTGCIAAVTFRRHVLTHRR